MPTTLHYRGQGYVKIDQSSKPSDFVELTYRHEHYNNRREAVKKELNQQFTYRGQKYIK